MGARALVVSAAFVLLAAIPSAAGNPESVRLLTLGYQHLYNLDYDEATREMEAAVKADPEDIAAERGLAVIPWLMTSFRRGTLTVDEYLGRITRSNVAMGTPPADLAARFHEHITRATQRAEAAVDARPDDPDARYELGAAIALQASYTATVEGSLLGAFRIARRAYREHERVLERVPARRDARVTVGTYRYVVATQALPVRLLAYVAGFGGGKDRGIAMLEEAAAASGEAQAEARVALVLIYNRESRFDDAMRVLRDLQRAYPRNRILWLEAGATALRAGRAQEAETLLTEAMTRLAADSRPRMFGEEALLYYKRGLARKLLKRRAEAEQDLRRALALEARPWVHDDVKAELARTP